MKQHEVLNLFHIENQRKNHVRKYLFEVKMYNETSKRIQSFSKELRREMTVSEKRLWYDFLKKQPFLVRRQLPISNYIVDFYIPSVKLVIELDGNSHYEGDSQEYDRERDEFLKSRGMTVIRYLNSQVQDNFDGVCKDILRNINRQQIER